MFRAGGESDGTVAAPHVVLNAIFDGNSNRTALDAAVAGNNDFQDTIGFDYLNRETSIVRQGASGGNAVAYVKSAFGYDAGSELTSVADYTTSTAELTHGSIAYDRAGRVASVQWHDDAHTGSGYGGAGNTGYWEQLSYSNDNNSRVTGITSTQYTGETASYSYDHTSQLTEEDLGSAYGGYGGPASKHLFTWDANGNPIGSSVGTPTGYGGYYYVTDNGYLIGDGNRLLSDGNYKYQFDAAGRLIKKFGIATGTIAEVDYTWDNRSRLVEVQNRSSVGGSVTLDIQYVYDMFDRLISRTQGSTTTLFAYDGQRMVLAFTSSGGISDRYVWGPAVDQILADEHYTTPSTSSAGTRYFTTFDKENSVRDLISSADSLSGHVVYGSFGQISSSTIGYAMPFLHEGVYADSATGMEYHSDPATGFPGRWYDPVSRRWLSEDPTGLAPDSNPYRPVDNSPTNYIDPTGQRAIVTVDHNNNVTIEIRIHFHGEGADSETIAKFKTGIERNWTGTFGKYKVTTHVALRDSDCNDVSIPKTFDDATTDWWLFASNNHDATIPQFRPAWTAAHEAGHLMGLPDRYKNVNHISVPDKGWEHTIMAERDGAPCEADIEQIININESVSRWILQIEDPNSRPTQVKILWPVMDDP